MKLGLWVVDLVTLYVVRVMMKVSTRVLKITRAFMIFSLVA